jgi:hypothetical protein
MTVFSFPDSLVEYGLEWAERPVGAIEPTWQVEVTAQV